PYFPTSIYLIGPAYPPRLTQPVLLLHGRSTMSTCLPAWRNASQDAPSPGSAWSHVYRRRSRSSRRGRTLGTPAIGPSGVLLSGISHRRQEFAAAESRPRLSLASDHTAWP